MVVLTSGEQVDVRLIGINAPDFGECLFREARARLTELVTGGRIDLTRDVIDRDEHGRWLRYAFTNAAPMLQITSDPADEGFADRFDDVVDG